MSSSRSLAPSFEERDTSSLDATLTLRSALRYVDPDADGDISWSEFQAATAKVDGPSSHDAFEAYCGGTICQLEAHMKKVRPMLHRTPLSPPLTISFLAPAHRTRSACSTCSGRSTRTTPA